MKRSLILTLSLLLFGNHGYVHAGETLDRVVKTGTLHNVIVNDYPPFAYLDENNKLAGFDVDVAQAVADKIGVKLKTTAPGWETIVGGKWAKRWDVCICSMTPNTERAQVLNFPVSYYNSPAVLVVNKDEKNIKNAADLTGKKVGAGVGSSYEKYLQGELVIPGSPAIDYPFKDVRIAPSEEAIAFQNLMLGPGVRLDAIIANLATAQEYMKQADKLRIIGEVYSEPNWVATDKGDAEFDELIRKTVEELRAEGTLKAISKKWFGPQIDITEDKSK